jgi:hypothetical protein
MPISQNYVGRSVDLCVLDTSSEPGVELVNPGILTSGSVIAGPYKIAQKFFKFMFTEKGSAAGDPDYGTNFVILLFTGQIQNEAELRLRFYQEASFAINYVRNSNTSTKPDENLVSADLQGFIVNGDQAILRIQFTFEDQSTILAPIAISTI